ncbi:MAG: CatB-related O-acetyltransferase [Thomasclavelia sp.]
MFIDKLKCRLLHYKNKQLLKKRKVYIAKKTYVDRTNFEGNNKINTNCHITLSEIGKGTYIGKNCNISNTHIGKYCSIGKNLNIIIGTHPSNGFVSTHPAFFSVRKQAGFTFANEDKFDEIKYVDKTNKICVHIENDVWIGANVSILQGVKIGNGAIIGANALVTKDVAPYTIIGGVPAKVINKRFEDDQIRKLLKLKWWNFDDMHLKESYDLFSDIEKFLESYDK